MALVAPPPDVPYDINGLRTFTDYECIAEILRSPNFGYGFPEVPQFRRTLAWTDGPEHSDRRRLEVRLFSNTALRLYERETLRPQVDEFFEECKRKQSDDGLFRADLTKLAELWLARLSARISGLDGVDTSHDANRFLDLTEHRRTAYFLKARPEEKAQYERDAGESTALLRAEFYEPSMRRREGLVARWRQGSLTQDDLPKDLLTLLLMHWNADWDEDLAFREVSLFLSGAIGTTVRSLVHLVNHLDAWFSVNPDERWRATDPGFVRRAAHESLRLHPVIPAMMRRALCEVKLSDGTVIAEDERVALLYGQGNRDPKVFGDQPDLFDPFRVPLVEGVPGYGLTFAFGPHVCIGRNMAIGGGEDEAVGAPTGTLLRMAIRLQEAGVRPDPESVPVYDWNSMWDRYLTYPIVLTFT